MALEPQQITFIIGWMYVVRREGETSHILMCQRPKLPISLLMEQRESPRILYRFRNRTGDLMLQATCSDYRTKSALVLREKITTLYIPPGTKFNINKTGSLFNKKLH